MMQLNSFNHFRAVAILFIVAGHCYGVAGLHSTSFAEKFAMNIITGGTALFVFISGFLFHHVFFKKFQYVNFLSKRIKYIFTPYLFLSIVPIFLYVEKRPDVFGGFFLPTHNDIFNEYIVPSIEYYLTGVFLSSYWYVPFILVTFMLSPLHCLFIKARMPIQIGITCLFCIISLFIHRPVDNIDVVQSVIYFTSVYLIGILCSLYKDNIYNIFNTKEYILLGLIIFFAVMQTLFGVVGNYHKSPLVYGGVDIMFIQKIIMCLFFMILLARFETFHSKMIHTLASTSFAIFFLHPFVIWWIVKGLHQYFNIDQYVVFNSWIIYIFMVAAVILLCVIIAKMVRKMIPHYSRFIIGY